MFTKPTIGRRVIVTMDWSRNMKGYADYVPRINTSVGTVVASMPFDDPDTFRMTTGDKIFPFSVVPLDYVTALKYDNGEKIAKGQARIIQNKSWQIKSDSRKGGMYTVTQEGNFFSCTCLGFQFHKNCRHIRKVKAA
jgi:hypothetical protein